MRREAEEYYRELGSDYPVRIRQLVPGYDQMAATLVGLLSRAVEKRPTTGAGTDGASGGDPETASVEPPAPAPRLVDLGIGEGTLALEVLEALPGIRLTGVDGSGSMLRRARHRLEDHLDRTELLEADLTDLRPPGPLTAAYSSLTLHNLRPSEKAALLRRVRRRLLPDAPVVWADLVRHSDPELQEHFTSRRIELARERGCPEEFITWNFEKEGSDDFPLTPDETREVAREAGFGRASTAWMHNVFAIFVLRE